MSEQFTLFADAIRSPVAMGPEGLQYREDFITPEAERELIGHIEALPLQPFQFGPYQGKRRVASFGHRYDYTLRRLQDAAPIPEWLKPVIAEVEAFGGHGTGGHSTGGHSTGGSGTGGCGIRIAQVLCTEYDAGVGIGWHRDKPEFDRVFGLSLGSPCDFRFRRKVGPAWQRFTLEVKPRSIYLMSGPSRQVWQHSIFAVEARRYSITFRTMAR